mmetsp:Transcript_17162/g.33639  ORF Transcript_17162/g.33639 Transcript_17162/m.33639 type:complete len:280 (+) Transcript_17162:351-1190(+)|eukprot:CAMPEP_0171526258 /NCGR_PEP_ID=MMETSP0959-20130129/10279_1 /TAXON_ID=87120 /ORGANISM="Aurantiochytrium limacinum, Strain ATCCMYA-1381" /LENGTH=279 /DNA_ID=CAMNT_0012067633 /DNA_START=268 /DNA_END=1107 /DNA_ORIENTATION=+
MRRVSSTSARVASSWARRNGLAQKNLAAAAAWSRGFSSQDKGKVRSTVDAFEAAKFAGLEWSGDEGHQLKLMHETRMGALRKYLSERHGWDNLEGMRVADIGCGGGLLSQSLMELGADVVAVDVASSNVEYTANKIKEGGEYKGTFEGRCTTAEGLFKMEGSRSFDMVLSLEVIEHVSDPKLFLESCAEMTNNVLAISTLDRSVRSFLLAIVAAEYVARMVPTGTHDWTKFVQPYEIEEVIHQHGLHTDSVVGMHYNPLFNSWSTSHDTSVNYIHFSSR